MGEAKRKRNALKEAVEELRGAQFTRAQLQACLPRGEEPIATRFDPANGCFQVACASGKVHKVPLGKLQRVVLSDPVLFNPDGEPIPPSPSRDVLPDVPYHVEQARRIGEAARRQIEEIERLAREHEEQCRCTTPDEDGDPDAPPCPLHPNGDGKQPKPWIDDILHTTAEWEIAAGRCAEYLMSGKHQGYGCMHYNCKLPAEYSVQVSMSRLVGVYCAQHALIAIRSPENHLDCDPEK